MSKTTTYARIRPDRTLVRGKPGGAEEPIHTGPLRPMTAAEIEAAAKEDLENPPITPQRRTRLRSVPRVKTLRRALGLTQAEFAGRYRIPLGTLRDWEQGRTEPDRPARAYLTVIARDPKGTLRALQAEPARL